MVEKIRVGRPLSSRMMVVWTVKRITSPVRRRNLLVKVVEGKAFFTNSLEVVAVAVVKDEMGDESKCERVCQRMGK